MKIKNGTIIISNVLKKTYLITLHIDSNIFIAIQIMLLLVVIL
jgi:hypothetical protein